MMCHELGKQLRLIWFPDHNSLPLSVCASVHVSVCASVHVYMYAKKIMSRPYLLNPIEYIHETSQMT